MIRLPGFDELGNANAETPEWRRWSMTDELRERCAEVASSVVIAENHLVL